MISQRYAIYYAPAHGSVLWQAGCRWLGRDPQSQAILEQPAVPGWSGERVRRLTQSARLYGLHATLKPPFRLASGRDVGALDGALQAFVAHRRALHGITLHVAPLAGFLALQPAVPEPLLGQLAEACVVQFDAFRRPADEQELVRRRAAGLTERQEALLREFGYPYVLEQFRFHVTLTDRLAPDELAVLQPWLSRYFSDALASPLTLDDICLFVQDAPGTPFRLLRRYPLEAV
jgi:putative phosphonate metabolism protein